MNSIFSHRPIKVSKFFLLLLIAGCMFLVDYKYSTFAELKNFFEIPRYYIMQTVNLPCEVFKSLNRYFVTHSNLVKENIYLKQLIKLQSGKLQIFNELETENARLRKLLNFAQSKKNVLSLANIIEVDPDPFKPQIIINKGFKQGAYIGQPIVNAEGVLGSLIKVEKNLSVGILITDLSYAIPVLNSRNGLRAIALGTGDLHHINLQHVPKTTDIRQGDIFVTSGLGGKYPEGYIVGKVNSVKKELNFPFAEVSLEVTAKLDSYGEILLIDNQVH